MLSKPVVAAMQPVQQQQPWLGGWHRYPAPPFYAGGRQVVSPPSGHMSARPGDTLSRTNLYIRGLSPHTTDKDLVNLCQK